MEVEPEVVVEATPAEQPKRGRPKKQATKKTVEVAEVPVETPQTAEPEPDVTPAVEETPAPEAPVEPKTPRAKTTKPRESAPKRTKKVSVAVEELKQAAEEVQDEEEAPELHTMSTRDLMTLQRLTARQVKSEKYKHLLRGHV